MAENIAAIIAGMFQVASALITRRFPKREAKNKKKRSAKRFFSRKP